MFDISRSADAAHSWRGLDGRNDCRQSRNGWRSGGDRRRGKPWWRFGDGWHDVGSNESCDGRRNGRCRGDGRQHGNFQRYATSNGATRYVRDRHQRYPFNHAAGRRDARPRIVLEIDALRCGGWWHRYPSFFEDRLRIRQLPSGYDGWQLPRRFEQHDHKLNCYHRDWDRC